MVKKKYTILVAMESLQSIENIMKVKLIKIKSSQNPGVPTSVHKELEADALFRSGESPWIDYEVEGLASDIPTVGEIYRIIRIARNKKPIPGLFSTSVVKGLVYIDEDIYEMETQNSFYLLKIL